MSLLCKLGIHDWESVYVVVTIGDTPITTGGTIRVIDYICLRCGRIDKAGSSRMKKNIKIINRQKKAQKMMDKRIAEDWGVKL